MKFIIGFVIIVGLSVYMFGLHEKSDSIEEKNKILAIENKRENPEKNTVAAIVLDKTENNSTVNPDLLEDENSIADKLSFEKANKKDINKLLSDFDKDVEQGNIPDELNQNMQGLFESAQQADWESFNSTVDFLESEDGSILSMALFQAVLNNAPLTIIENLLHRGAIFFPNTAQMLALRNNVKLTKALLPLGLDLHAVDLSGKNSLSHTLVSFQSKEMFDFLLANNVDVKPSPNGLDPLDMALQYTLNNAQGVYYVKQLLAYGAPVESSHMQLFSQIQKQNPYNYEKIAVFIPN
ncbi:hypothetical protein SG34_002655 [Thalassomonas viridans]|uniref:Ankyrin n=1 Tax=Thalassomonas viridans TaxID=137584 RepID=A0AAE9Z4E0_9GAMM|nr:hypothetical protein [Thalassomonas viridans]WDE05854.1 hypothetical protein SG34_002655 [Thalassomonas viridans]